MNQTNSNLFARHRDILSFRDLSDTTVASYTSNMSSYIQWVEAYLLDRELQAVTWEDLRSYIRWLKDVRGLNPLTVNVHITQLRDFYYYVLHKYWNKREIPFLHFDEKLPIVPTREQVNAIISSIANPKHKEEIAFLYSSGMRISELC